VISGSGGPLIAGFYDQETEIDGIGSPLIVQFENGGSIEVTVMLDSVGTSSSVDRVRIDENVTFNMTVIPKFLSSVLLLVVGTVTGVVILVSRTYPKRS